MTDSGDDGHPLQGRWKPASTYVWGGHVSPQFVLLLLLSHTALLGWFVSDWDHVRMVLYAFHEVPSEETVNESPADLALHFDYEEDPVEALSNYKAIATPIVAGATSAGDRARRLGDYIYSLRRPDSGNLVGDLRFGPEVIYQKMLEGSHADCGQMSTILATFWRSLGGHSRAVRWAARTGRIGHYAVELWDEELQGWFYYDMNLNGFAHDDDGVTPLSVAALRANLLTGEDVHVTASPVHHDYSLADLISAVRDHPRETYVLNNDYLHWSPNRRFGLLNRFYPALSSLPHPWDRIVDNITGGRDRRLVVDGRLLVAGWFSFRGARLFLAYLLAVMIVCATTLRRTSLTRPAGTSAPTAADTRPSR
jgi:transglutaminase-like putative cysteine protease